MPAILRPITFALVVSSVGAFQNLGVRQNAPQSALIAKGTVLQKRANAGGAQIVGSNVSAGRSMTRTSAHSAKMNKSIPIEELTESTALPDVSTVLQNSHQVFSAMSSQMVALEARLAEVQHQGAQAVQEQKSKFEAKLKVQRGEAHATELINAGVVVEIDELRKSNALLRKKADKLAQASNKVKSDIQAMQGNITTAAEFIEKTLTASEALENSTELTVLAELAEQDGIQASALNHQRHLQSIGLLQNSEEVQPQNLLQSLLSSFGDLTKEQEVSEHSLKDAFEKEFQAGSDRQKALLEEQAKLNVTKQSETELKEKLLVAVKHLETAHSQLLQRSQSLQLFMKRFGEHSTAAKK